MFKHLEYSVTFAATPLRPEKTMTGIIDFELGLTAILGGNGKGKSLVLEMAQYALFGSAALRGKADTYKRIDVDLTSVINGIEYRAVRAGSNVKVFQGETPLATGTKPVNQKIVALLGYSYDVFKVANISQQGEIEKLGNMLPTARKKLIDETIGLNALDELSTYIGKEAANVSATIRALEPLVVMPTAPVKQEGLEAPEVYSNALGAFNLLLQRRAVFQAAASKVLYPVEVPELHPEAAELSKYQAEAELRTTLMNQYTLLSAQKATIPVSTVGEEVKLHERDAELDTLREYKAGRDKWLNDRKLWEAELAKLPETELALGYLMEQEDLHMQVTRVQQKLKLKEKNVPHDCPACKHHWEDADPRLATEFAQVPDVPPVPELSMEAIAVAHKALAVEDRVAELKKLINEADAVQVDTEEQGPTIAAIEAARKAYAAAEVSRANQARLVDLEAQIKDVEGKFEKTVDRAGVISDIKTAEGARQTALLLKSQYDIAKQEQDAAKQELASIPANLDTLVAEAQTALQAAQAYVLHSARYDADMKKFEDLLAQLNGHKNDLEDWKKGRDAVAELRAKVKGYIVPALNSVATKLVNEMTGGELSQVAITEEMEITVDGQDLETLSGAGKGVTNLGLRLALGQVLTNSVFPAILLDEVDASFDNDRAEFTANCLRRLSKVYKQVIIVSHKAVIEADNYVRL